MTENAYITEERTTMSNDDYATWAVNSLLESGQDRLASDLAADLGADLVADLPPVR